MFKGVEKEREIYTAFRPNHVRVIVHPRGAIDSIRDGPCGKLVEEAPIFGEEDERFVEERTVNVALEAVRSVVWDDSWSLESVVGVDGNAKMIEKIDQLAERSCNPAVGGRMNGYPHASEFFEMRRKPRDGIGEFGFKLLHGNPVLVPPPLDPPNDGLTMRFHATANLVCHAATEDC